MHCRPMLQPFLGLAFIDWLFRLLSLRVSPLRASLHDWRKPRYARGAPEHPDGETESLQVPFLSELPDQR